MFCLAKKSCLAVFSAITVLYESGPHLIITKCIGFPLKQLLVVTGFGRKIDIQVQSLQEVLTANKTTSKSRSLNQTVNINVGGKHKNDHRTIALAPSTVKKISSPRLNSRRLKCGGNANSV